MHENMGSRDAIHIRLCLNASPYGAAICSYYHACNCCKELAISNIDWSSARKCSISSCWVSAALPAGNQQFKILIETCSRHVLWLFGMGAHTKVCIQSPGTQSLIQTVPNANGMGAQVFSWEHVALTTLLKSRSCNAGQPFLRISCRLVQCRQPSCWAAR